MLYWNGNEYRKIILLGSAGSGKSYLSKKLAGITKIPLTHLDNEFWKPGWTKTPKEKWVLRQKELIGRIFIKEKSHLLWKCMRYIKIRNL